MPEHEYRTLLVRLTTCHRLLLSNSHRNLCVAESSVGTARRAKPAEAGQSIYIIPQKSVSCAG